MLASINLVYFCILFGFIIHVPSLATVRGEYPTYSWRKYKLAQLVGKFNTEGPKIRNKKKIYPIIQAYYFQFKYLK